MGSVIQGTHLYPAKSGSDGITSSCIVTKTNLFRTKDPSMQNVGKKSVASKSGSLLCHPFVFALFAKRSTKG